MAVVGDDDGADLLVGEEFYAGVGEDAEQGGAVAAEQAQDALVQVDVLDRCRGAESGGGVLAELGVVGLEEDLDAVKGRDDCFCLCV